MSTRLQIQLLSCAKQRLDLLLVFGFVAVKNFSSNFVITRTRKSAADLPEAIAIPV